MTILSTTEDWATRDSEESLFDGIVGTRVFDMESDTPVELESVVYAACPVVLGESFPGTLTSQCYSRKATRYSDTRTRWRVACSYKSLLNQTEQDRIDNPVPTNRPARITWASRTVMTAVTRMQRAQSASGELAYRLFNRSEHTFDGEVYSVANTAGDPFDPAMEVPVTQWIATVSKNVPVVPSWVLNGYDNSVNDADVTIDGLTLLRGCGKLEGIAIGESLKENGYVYRQLSFSIICAPFRPKRTRETDAPEPWDIEVLNEGMREPDSSSGWRNITDSSDQSVAKPVPLDLDGMSLDPSGAPIPETDLYWCLFRPFLRKDWSVLPLT
jgi:hypothetical protein